MTEAEIAKEVHKNHREYCASINHKTQPVWSKLEESHKQTIASTVNKILSSEIKSKEDSHINFVNFKKSLGWKFGDAYSIELKTNPRLCNFEDLSKENRMKEEIFFNTVIKYK
tara:strand:- start:111 stop:449 length:339 start_codon:yes stop_codon:yes gene_type:complete